MGTDLTPMVVDFLLRRSPDDRVVNDVLQFLPLPDNNLRLKKALLLRKIDSEISKGSVSEKTLEFLELIDELEHQNGVTSSDSLKLAYCAVAVECAFRCLDEPNDGDKNFFFAVKRIWKARVSKMEGGLVSDELQSWRKEIEEAVWDSSVCESARLKSRKIDALGAVKSYVAEGWASLGPSLLELEFGRVDDDESLKEVLKLCNTIIQDQVGDKGVCLGSSCPDPTVENASKERDRDVVLPKRRSSRPRRSQGAKITSQDDESDVGPSANNSLPTPGANDDQQDHRKNSVEPQTAPTDPTSGTETGGINGEGSIEGRSGVYFHPPNPCHGKSTEVGHGNEADCSHGNDVPKSSSVSQNVFVSIRKQDDCESRPHLGTKKQRLVTPVEKKSVTKYVRKRDIKRWSLEEEDTLRTGVQLYGMGQWKVILNAYRDVFEERTEVDLKDKWRNMTR